MLQKRYEIFQRPMKTSITCTKALVKACCALHNYHLRDDESALPRSNGRKGRYSDYVKADGSIVYGRYKNEDPENERKIHERLKKEVEEATSVPDQDQPEKLLSGNKLADILIDYFIENDLPWQWRSAGIVR